MPLRAVIFDYGLVLSGPAVPAARARLLEITGLSPETFDTHYWKYRLDYDRGTLNGRTYWQTIARDAGLPLTSEQIDALIEQDILLWASINPVMLDWVGRVQAAGFKTAILSNMGEDLLAHMRRNFQWLDSFHHLTWSCELDTVKPEPEIYRHTLERLGVNADEALFLDDKIENVEGARALGMRALLFRDPCTLEADLRKDKALAGLPPVIG
ncbi:MAG: HAD family phosphatase [Acidobacteriaceae bacterium]